LEEGPKAIELLEDCYERTKKTLGEDNATVMQVASALALSYDDAGRSEEAEAILRDTLEREIARFGDDHPHTITVKQNLASILRVQDRYEEAAPLYESSVVSAANMLGEKHIMTMKYRSNLALFYSDMGDYEKAETMSVAVVRDREEILGPNNSSTLASSLNLALLYLRIEKYDKCIAMAGELRDRCMKVLGSDHLYTAIIESTYGQAELKNGNAEVALEIFESSLDRYTRRYPDEKHWRVGHAHVVRGEAYFALGQYGNAEADYLKGHRILDAALDPTNRRVIHVMECLVALYGESGDPEKRAAWAERLASTQEAS
ncbi:MAG: tetratricopeptide repeat protein, partial [Candidatus Eisenbacteria bacterium]|nr:tetratricopeptide repeat protein [Candidatus Eisenbacteria bacterium]